MIPLLQLKDMPCRGPQLLNADYTQTEQLEQVGHEWTCRGFRTSDLIGILRPVVLPFLAHFPVKKC